MTASRLKPTLLAATVGMLLACIAHAQTPATDAEKARELAAARADLDRAARRVAELSRGMAPENVAIRHLYDRQPVLGVVLEPDDRAGVRIAAVTPDSGAAKAGLLSGDRITAIGGVKLDAASGEQRLLQARAQLRSLDVDSTMSLDYERNGRAVKARVKPQLGERVKLLNGRDYARTVMVSEDFAMPELAPLIAPQVRTELIRLGPMGDCKDSDCRLPVLAEAFRWSGLNLAAIDKDLGRYFGTDRGVLVLSTGQELQGLQAGDVIQRIDGKTVASPREAMAALRGKPADSRVKVDYLRDRQSATAQVSVPKAMPLSLPLVPPAPPAPPKPPKPPKAALPAPPAAPAAPAALPAPPAPPAPPPAPAAPTPPKFAIVL